VCVIGLLPALKIPQEIVVVPEMFNESPDATVKDFPESLVTWKLLKVSVVGRSIVVSVFPSKTTVLELPSVSVPPDCVQPPAIFIVVFGRINSPALSCAHCNCVVCCVVDIY